MKYFVCRTDVKKLQEVRSSGEICDVNIILTNPDLLHLCANEEDVENRNQESSPERTSYRYESNCMYEIRVGQSVAACLGPAIYL